MEKSSGEWTKRELEMYGNPVAALAAAVVRQWKLDGSPESGREAAELWEKVYDEAVSLKQKNP